MARLATLLPLLLLAVALWGVWDFEYLSYDDPEYVTENPAVQRGLTAEGLRWAFTSAHAANWHPLTWLSHMADRSFFGPGPSGPHAVNLVLHALATLALWAALRALGLPLPLLLLCAGIYAAHPTRLESVAWISERKDVLSALFGWLCLWAHLRFVREGRARDRWLGVGALALGLLAKPMLVSWPLVLVVIDRWWLKRDSGWRRLFAEKWPHFALALAAALATLFAQSEGGAMRAAESIALGDRLLNALLALSRYPLALLWPARLSFFYPHPALVDAPTGPALWRIALAALALLAVAYSCLRVRDPRWRGAWLLYLVTILPVIGILQVGPQAYADRYLAIPGVGLCLVLGLLLQRLLPVPRAQLALVLAACVASALATRAQLPHWRDDLALYGRALAVTEHNWLAHGNLGRTLLQQGRVDEAEQQFRLALAARSDDAISHYNLGTLLLESGRNDAAERHLRAAIVAQPEHAQAHNNLAQLLARAGRNDEALALQARAVELAPREPDFALNLADLERRSGQIEPALARLDALLRERPQWAEAHDLLARIHFERDPARALEHAEQAVALSDARDARLLETLAHCERQAGQSDRAAATAQRALALAQAAGDAARTERLRQLLGELQ